MRKLSALSLALALPLLAAVAAGAQTDSHTASTHTTTTTTQTTTAPATDTTATTQKSATSKYHRANGDITSMDASAQTFTVTHGTDSWTFKTDKVTKIKGLGKTIAFSDLQVGDNVRVSYTESGGDKTAARIDVLHGKK
jgi:anti-sigma28 factor (negative regulator of flagellin synthesis)